MTGYLTEKSLGNILTVLFPDEQFEAQKKFKLYRADYCCEKLKLVIEFDWIDHYQKSTVVKSDQRKDNYLRSLGYKVVRIPFFVQLSKEVIFDLFGINVDFKQTFPHGFIAKETVTMTPDAFCFLGLKRFADDLKRFSYLKDDILKSLDQKAKEFGDDMVYPLGSKKILMDYLDS